MTGSLLKHVAEVLARICSEGRQVGPCACLGPNTCQNPACALVWETLLGDPKALRTAFEVIQVIRKHEGNTR